MGSLMEKTPYLSHSHPTEQTKNTYFLSTDAQSICQKKKKKNLEEDKKIGEVDESLAAICIVRLGVSIEICDI